MVNFSKFKYISLSSSILIILLGFIITFAINKGFAHSLDFNGGLRTVIEAPSDKQRESIQKFLPMKESIQLSFYWIKRRIIIKLMLDWTLKKRLSITI